MGGRGKCVLFAERLLDEFVRSMLVTSLLCLGTLLVSGARGQCPPCPAPPVIPCCRQADQAGLCCELNSVKLVAGYLFYFSKYELNDHPQII